MPISALWTLPLMAVITVWSWALILEGTSWHAVREEQHELYQCTFALLVVKAAMIPAKYYKYGHSVPTNQSAVAK
jgi:hypothetical protein